MRQLSRANTMVGNDRSGTVDANLNLLKAVELALTGGHDLHPYLDPMTGKTEKNRRWGPDTGDPTLFRAWEQFWDVPTAPKQNISSAGSSIYTS